MTETELINNFYSELSFGAPEIEKHEAADPVDFEGIIVERAIFEEILNEFLSDLGPEHDSIQVGAVIRSLVDSKS